MKKRWFVITCLLALLAVINGCGDGHKAQKVDGKTVDANSFPAFLAGTWQVDTGANGVWRFVLTPDGRVSEAVDLWQEVLHPNQTTDFNMLDGPIHITAGNFYVSYRPSKRELSVTTELKDIHIFLPGLLVDANSVDYYNGPVSEDGNTWTAERIEIFSFSDLPQDPNLISPEPIIFRKVQPQAAVVDSNEKH
jgi:hypothetical protein